MKTQNQPNDDMAAALFFLLGEPVPHRRSLEDEAQRLADETGDREKLLLKIIAFCAEPETPKQLYLTARAYSWLGKKYYKEAARFSSDYLHTEGWGELPGGVKMEDGIRVDHTAANHASVLMDLAKAQEGLGRIDAALANYMEAYRIAPYNAMIAIKAADAILKLHGREEALMFLMQQKKCRFYEPVAYTDPQGRACRNDLFQQLLDAHILKLEQKEQTGW